MNPTLLADRPSSPATPSAARYAKCIENSRRVRWDIDRDVIRGRRFDYSQHFLPAGLSRVAELPFLSAEDQRTFSQVQGRTYACMFGLVERFIAAKMLEVGRANAFDDQVALEALVRMTDEELKHQELFRRLDAMMAAEMPAGYLHTADANAVAGAVLSQGTWAVLALTLHIELFSQAHYRASIEPDTRSCPLWKDVFLFHWKEESQHAVVDEMELVRADARLTSGQRDAAVDEFLGLVGAVDGILQVQAKADSDYFCRITGRGPDGEQRTQIEATMLKAYRWQYIVSGAMEPRFQKLLFSLVNEAQAARIRAALEPLAYAVPAHPEMELPMAA